MLKYLILLPYLVLLAHSPVQAERSQYINLAKLTNKAADNYNDIGYIHIVPQFEEKMDPKRAISMEMFFGEYDGSEESLRRLDYIKELLANEKQLNPNFQPEIIGVSKEHNALKNSRDFQHFLARLGEKSNTVHYDEVPSFLYNETTSRNPSSNRKRSLKSFFNGKNTWTLIRFSSVTAGSVAALYFMHGVSPHLAIATAFWPGISSAALTYYSNYYGAFMTNGRWSTWLMESDNFFTRNLRKSLGVNVVNLTDSLHKNKDYFKKEYPTLYKQNPQLFTQKAQENALEEVTDSQKKFNKILIRMRKAEEYLKWWVTEIAFTALTIKLPQAIAGVSEVGSLVTLTGDILSGATMGVLAQGFGDIAIQVRKYQMMEELKADILNNKVIVDRPQELLIEIDKVLAEKGPYKDYHVHNGSHKELIKIENWSRSRSTLLSLFAVTGVGLEIAGVPLARPLLIATGIGGAAYYASVQGWIKPQKITKRMKEYLKIFKDGDIKFNLQAVNIRECTHHYMLKN